MPAGRRGLCVEVMFYHANENAGPADPKGSAAPGDEGAEEIVEAVRKREPIVNVFRAQHPVLRLGHKVEKTGRKSKLPNRDTELVVESCLHVKEPKRVPVNRGEYVIAAAGANRTSPRSAMRVRATFDV